MPPTLPTVGPLAVYFSFADGALGYDCVSCGAKCCYGFGFGATESELVQLRKHYPLLPMFVQPRTDPNEPLVNLTNFTTGCAFLRKDGRCGVEVDHGRDIKPYVCRAFPANQLQRLGVLLVAEVNFLCPLKPAGPGDTPLRHADVLADLAQSIEVPTQVPDHPADLFPEALLFHEAFLRDLPIDDDLLGRYALADVMAPRWERAPSAPTAAFVAPHRAYLAGLRREMHALLGLDGRLDPERPLFARELAIMMPRHRLGLLRLRPSDRPSLEALLPQLGRRLLAIAVYVELVATLGVPVTLAVIDQAWRHAQVFCELLAMADRVPIIVPGGDEAYKLTLYKTQEAAMQRFLRFVHDENPRRRLTLREVLLEIGLEDPTDRAQLCQSFTREALPRFRFEPRA